MSRYLLVQSDERLRQLCPATLPALVSLFPVLRRVDFPYDLFEDESVISDPLELVDRATDALAEILSRLGETRPVILWIDDLQWSDAASLDLLNMRMPLIFCTRSMPGMLSSTFVPTFGISNGAMV